MKSHCLRKRGRFFLPPQQNVGLGREAGLLSAQYDGKEPSSAPLQSERSGGCGLFVGWCYCLSDCTCVCVPAWMCVCSCLNVFACFCPSYCVCISLLNLSLCVRELSFSCTSHLCTLNIINFNCGNLSSFTALIRSINIPLTDIRCKWVVSIFFFCFIMDILLTPLCPT